MNRLPRALGALAAGLVVAVLGPASAALADTANPVPYTDPSSVGVLTLCDRDGNEDS